MALRIKLIVFFICLTGISLLEIKKTSQPKQSLSWQTLSRHLAQEAAPAALHCESLFTIKSHRYKEKILELKKIKYGVKWSDLVGLYPESPVFLGIKEPNHAYLVVGDQIFSGEIFDRARIYRTQDDQRKFLNEGGVLFHLKNIDPETLSLLKEALKADREKQTLSCVNGACRILANSGIFLNQKHDVPIFLGELIEQALSGIFYNDFKNSEIEVEALWNSEKHNLESFLGYLNNRDKILKRGIQMKYAGLAKKHEAEPDKIVDTLGNFADATRGQLLLLVKNNAQNVGAFIIISFASLLSALDGDDEEEARNL